MTIPINEVPKNRKSMFTIIGATGHGQEERQEFDYYATHPSALHALKSAQEKYQDFYLLEEILEPCAGRLHLSDALKEYGHIVYSHDLVKRNDEIIQNDFLTDDFSQYHNKVDIVTNPPYKLAIPFLDKSLSIVAESRIVAMFLKLTFLEGKSRKDWFEQNPPKWLYVFSNRAICSKNGDFDSYNGSAIAYAWYIWEKGYKGVPQIRWITHDANWKRK